MVGCRTCRGDLRRAHGVEMRLGSLKGAVTCPGGGRSGAEGDRRPRRVLVTGRSGPERDRDEKEKSGYGREQVDLGTGSTDGPEGGKSSTGEQSGYVRESSKSRLVTCGVLGPWFQGEVEPVMCQGRDDRPGLTDHEGQWTSGKRSSG